MKLSSFVTVAVSLLSTTEGLQDKNLRHSTAASSSSNTNIDANVQKRTIRRTIRPAATTAATPSKDIQRHAQAVNNTQAGNNEYYPAWSTEEKTCKNDGNAPDYMKDDGGYYTQTLKDCCERYYSYDLQTCMGSTPMDIKGFYPASDTNEIKCMNVADATPPAYMLSSPAAWIDPDIETCCSRRYAWAKDECISASVEAEEKKTKKKMIPMATCSANSPVVLNNSTLLVASAADAITVHKKYDSNGSARYSIVGCGSVLDLSSGKRVAVICTTGAVDESSPTSSVYMKFTTCKGTFGLIGQLPIEIEQDQDGNDTFSMPSTTIEGTVTSATEKFKSGLGKHLKLEFPFFSIPQPVIGGNANVSARDRSLVAVGGSTSVIVTVNGAKIATSPKNVCYSPSDKDYSWIKVCGGENSNVGVADSHIHCSTNANGVKTCFGAGISAGSNGLCLSAGVSSGSGGVAGKQGVSLCCSFKSLSPTNTDINICKDAAEKKGIENPEEDPENNDPSTEDSDGDVLEVTDTSAADPSPSDGDGTNPVSDNESSSSSDGSDVDSSDTDNADVDDGIEEDSPSIDIDSSDTDNVDVDDVIEEDSSDGISIDSSDTTNADNEGNIGEDSSDGDVGGSADTTNEDVDGGIGEDAPTDVAGDVGGDAAADAGEAAGETVGETILDAIVDWGWICLF